VVLLKVGAQTIKRIASAISHMVRGMARHGPLAEVDCPEEAAAGGEVLGVGLHVLGQVVHLLTNETMVSGFFTRQRHPYCPT
jgi:predicted dehydrogenase